MESMVSEGASGAITMTIERCPYQVLWRVWEQR